MSQEEIAALSNRDLLMRFAGLVFEIGGLDTHLEYWGNFAGRLADALGYTTIINDVRMLADEIIRRMGVPGEDERHEIRGDC